MATHTDTTTTRGRRRPDRRRAQQRRDILEQHAELSLTIDESAAITGLCRRTIYAEINSGRLKSFKVGTRRLVTRRALDAWAAERERESGVAA